MSQLPFSHQDLELKNQLIEYARELMKKNIGSDEDVAAAKLAAGLLYANLADYLAANLLQSLEEMSKVATREYLNGSIVYRAKSNNNLPLEKTIKKLKDYDFSSRETVLRLLNEVRKNRNKLAHEMFKSPDLADIGKAALMLAEECEELVSEFNALYRNMPPQTIIDTASKNGSEESGNG